MRALPSRIINNSGQRFHTASGRNQSKISPSQCHTASGQSGCNEKLNAAGAVANKSLPHDSNARGATQIFTYDHLLSDETKPIEWPQAEKQALIRLARSGAPMEEIKAKLKRHVGSIKRKARIMNLVVKK